ncbi:MAG TPA: hypothetical protein PK294_10950 [Ignavibacteria bacterium]|nr:hypothetical protein [Ignavibacteria bacterium]HQY53017.1 hypothetical protein [Ignavibacteria bacterium]HRB00943.1 hypothetical protein [Ignavibacteria bacterium]
MTEQNKINELIFEVIKEINESLPSDKKIKVAADTVLYGSKSKLDSFGLVNLIVGVEEKIQDETGISITIADEKALSRKNSPFLTVKTLSDYVSELLNNVQKEE